MSQEGTTASPGRDSFSPANETVSSSVLTPSPPSQPSGDNLTSLLLQIQQFHSSEIQKLQKEVDRFKAKCKKLAMISNDNANVAMRHRKQNKELQAQVAELTCQLRILQSARQEGRPVEKDSANSPTDKALQPDTAPRSETTQVRESRRKMSRMSSKLTTRNSKKKVRYSEVAGAESLREQGGREMAKPNPGTGVNRPGEMNSFVDRSAEDDLRGGLRGEILALDTCVSPASRDHGKLADKMTTPANFRRKPSDLNFHAVPETLGMEDEVGACHSTGSPTFTSTPLGMGSQSQASGSSQVRRSRLDLPARASISRTSSLPVGGRKAATFPSPLPKSESQFPVDLSSTQAESPTFCGDGTRSTTPRGAANTSSRRSAASVLSDSCESEASILLLETNSANLRPNPSQLTERSKEGPALSKKRLHSEQRKSPKKLHTLPVDPQTVRNNQLERTSVSLQSQDSLSKLPAPKKRKLDLEDLSFDETVLPDEVSLDKENFLHVGDGNNEAYPEVSCVPPNQDDAGLRELTAEKSAAKSKNLRQVKLDLGMLGPTKSKSGVLMRSYNGGSQVDADSQSDVYIKKAIKLSLADLNKDDRQKTSPGSSKVSEVSDGGFKVPPIPYSSRKHLHPDTSPSGGKSLVIRLPQGILSGPSESCSLETLSPVADLNGSIDPLVDLTSLEGAASQLDDRREDFRHREGQQRGARQPWEADDSLDLFDEREAEEEEKRDLEEVEEVDEEEEYEAEQNPTSYVAAQAGLVHDYDKIPKTKTKPAYKYTEVVRKHEERQKLKGFGCKECEQFYAHLPLTEAEKKERMKICSRHRGHYSPPNTPEHYWSVGFPDTQTCLQRGYIKESNSPTRQSRKRKSKKYKMLFSGKDEEGVEEEEMDFVK